jgi:hypothetical protein
VTLASETAGGACTLVRADESSPRGWHAPFYGDRQPALSLDRTVQADQQVFWTLFSPRRCRIQTSALEFTIDAEDWRAELTRGTGKQAPLVRSITYSTAFNPQSAIHNPQSETRLELTGCTSC